MFKNLVHQLTDLDGGATVSVPIEADERGYIDRQCPAQNCLFIFKVLKSDWREKFRDEAVFCPQCGHEAPAKSWHTRDQFEAASTQAFAVVRAQVNRAIIQDAAEFNAGAPRGFVHWSIKVDGGRNALHVVVPIAAAAVLEQELACEVCEARYAVLGTAFFCPCCGPKSARKMFDAALAKVRTKLDNIDSIRQALRLSTGPDAAETLCRSMIEGGLQDCVVAFQHLAEELYVVPAGEKPPSQNTFQRLDDGSERWRSATGLGYDDVLSAAELLELKMLFQRRHLLAHKEGIVDETYVKKSTDLQYKVGQRIVVSEADVKRMVFLVEKLGTALRNSMKSSA